MSNITPTISANVGFDNRLRITPTSMTGTQVNINISSLGVGNYLISASDANNFSAFVFAFFNHDNGGGTPNVNMISRSTLNISGAVGNPWIVISGFSVSGAFGNVSIGIHRLNGF